VRHDAELDEVIHRQHREISECIAAIQARPACATRVSLKDVPENWEDLRPAAHSKAAWPGYITNVKSPMA